MAEFMLRHYGWPDQPGMVWVHTLATRTVVLVVMGRGHTPAAPAVAVAVMGRVHTRAVARVGIAVMDVQGAALQTL